MLAEENQIEEEDSVLERGSVMLDNRDHALSSSSFNNDESRGNSLENVMD